MSANFMPPFQKYRKKHSLLDLANEVGISKSWINQLARGEKPPSLFLAFDIQYATRGKIKAEDFVKYYKGEK